jgi:GNAT superfamily N-acetyltransferase
MPDASVIVSADTVDPDLLRLTFTAAFADYLIGPFDVSLDAWPGFLARQGVDLRLSRVALGPATPLAFALVAPRPRLARWRLATMGAVPAARGTGVAARLLDDVIERATSERLRGLELEVFAANGRACRLYRSRGFQPMHALFGYQLLKQPPTSAAAPGVQVHEPDHAAAFAWLDLAEESIPDLPLQVTRDALSALPERLRAWTLGSAQLIFSESADGAIVIRSLIDRDPSQRDARALVDQLVDQRPGAPVRVPQLQRRDVGGAALVEAGFATLPQHQWLMLRSLG